MLSVNKTSSSINEFNATENEVLDNTKLLCDTDAQDETVEKEMSIKLDSADTTSNMTTIRARAKEIEEEAKRLDALHNEMAVHMASPTRSTSTSSNEDKKTIDDRSVYIGNVDYSATAVELEQIFKSCGTVVRVNIMCNKFDGHPKGFAYIEFVAKESVVLAIACSGTLLKDRPIIVSAKRTNQPGISSTNRFPRGFRGQHAQLSRRGHVPRGYVPPGFEPRGNALCDYGLRPYAGISSRNRGSGGNGSYGTKRGRRGGFPHSTPY